MKRQFWTMLERTAFEVAWGEQLCPMTLKEADTKALVAAVKTKTKTQVRSYFQKHIIRIRKRQQETMERLAGRYYYIGAMAPWFGRSSLQPTDFGIPAVPPMPRQQIQQIDQIQQIEQIPREQPENANWEKAQNNPAIHIYTFVNPTSLQPQ